MTGMGAPAGGSSFCRAGAELPPHPRQSGVSEPRSRLPMRAPLPAERRGERGAAAVTAPEPQLPAGPPLCLRLPIADQWTKGSGGARRALHTPTPLLVKPRPPSRPDIPAHLRARAGMRARGSAPAAGRDFWGCGSVGLPCVQSGRSLPVMVLAACPRAEPSEPLPGCFLKGFLAPLIRFWPVIPAGARSLSRAVGRTQPSRLFPATRFPEPL